MRLSIAAIVFALLAAVGIAPAPVQAATPVPAKVVIIVGPVEGSTSSYRSAADEAYAEAIKYTSDVTRIYSPDATWSRVKAATVGASVVIYLGHGNGWPSPYTYDPQYTTKDGFGLNATAGAGDSNNKYYGEPYIADLDLAPDAIVILNHLCYASGNSEPGDAEPTRSVARQRVDNFASAFLKAGASAVIADGHGNAAPYVRSLFTISASLVDLWRGVSSNGNELSWASTRTPGASALTDTETATTGYYRSLVTQPGKTTADVLAGVGTITPYTPATAPAASDISSSKFKADIEWLYASGLTTGCSPTKFCPNGVVTRGQMASFLARALKLPSSTKDYFKDDGNVSHEANINKIAKAGLTVGCATNRYCPTGVVTRGQMASFLARSLDLPASAKDYFWDDGNVSHEANINRIAKAGLTSGCGGGRFCPTSVLTRGQMAAFLHRAFGD